MKKTLNYKRKKKSSILVALIAVIMQIFTMLPGVQVKATDTTNIFPFITEVTLTDGNGNDISKSTDPISKNAEVKLTYKFTIPNQGTVKDGDTYTMKIPKEIQIISTLSFPITLDNGETIANVKIETDGNVTITFTGFVEKNSNVSGFFYIDTQFDPDQIGGPSPVPIKFEIGGNSSPVIVNVNFEQPEIPDASAEKYGEYDASKNEITWEVLVNRENVKVNNAQIMDKISKGQEFIPGSVTINGASADIANYNYDSTSKILTYNFPSAIDGYQTIKFKTKVVNPKAFESEGATVYEYNKAIFNHDGTNVESNEASVAIYTDFIRKYGNYDVATKKINWVIEVNNNAQSISNAVVTDDIPSGLTFTPGSLKVDGVETKDNYTIDGQRFTYTFPTAINEPHIIEFSTDVTDKDAHNSNDWKTYTNKATLTGSGVPGNASDENGVDVPTNVISKKGVGYNPATGEITWEVMVNWNGIAIKNPVVTDKIKLGQEYVDGSFTIDKDVPGGSFNYVKAADGDSEKTGTLTYTFSDDINETYIIRFKTKVTDPKVYAGNRNENYYNVAELTGDNIKPSNYEGKQNVRSQVVNKFSSDYNYVTREITWKIVVNKNKMTLPNAYIIDDVKEGQEFVSNSVMINGKPAEASNYVYDETAKTLRYNFPSEIKDEQVVTFKTKIIDTSIFNSNGQKEFKNTASLITDLVPGGVESTGKGTIKSTLIDKKADYTRGNSYIDWNVTINSNKILINDAALTDILQEGLELDTTSIKLYKQILKPDGSLEKGEEVVLNQSNVKYNSLTREFTFTLPSPTEEAYILTFRTDVVDKSKSPFTNAISFKGTGIDGSSSSGSVDVIFQGAGGGGVGETGSVTVTKVDKNNENIKLEGAVFELLDKYENVIRTSDPTGENGEVVFSKLRFDIDYYVREKLAPTGYTLSSELYKFQLKNAKDTKNITYNYKDEKIKGKIEFIKLDEDKSPLKGAEFTLYKEADTNFETPVAVAISDENGLVSFKDVEYGKYTIKETKAPEGYLLSGEILTANIIENGSTIKANPESISNTKIRGNIEFTKLGEDKNPLQGAEFKLYKEADTNYENPVAVAISDENGLVKFKDVEYGKYTIKETKAPEGYVLSSEILTANISEDGSTIKANPESISNTKIRGDIEFAKLGEDKNPLQGAAFKLYKESDTNFESPVAVAISDENGLVSFKDVEYGKYNIKETKAPEGYLLSAEILTANITENGVTIKANPESISNTKIRGNIEFTKLGEDNSPLKGAEFKLYKESDANFESPVAAAISDENGLVSFKDVEYGKYNVKETKAPEGYVLSSEVLAANIMENGVTIKANPESISNTKIRGNIEFAKLGENNSPLKGAEFKLYKESDANFESPVEVAISDENGLVSFKDVEYGKYNIKETKAPEGYLLSAEILTANITENGVTIKANPESISNTKIRGNIEFTKLGEDNSPLKGAEFKLYKESDANFESPVEVAISDENGLVSFKDVEYGKYNIKETKAPEGYVLSSEVLTANITENGSTIKANPESISNAKIRASVQVKKFDQDKKPLKGAEFTLYNSEGKEVLASVTGKDGIAIFENLVYGEYTIKETKVPEGYLASEGTIKIFVDKDSELYSYEVVNNRIKGSIIITKVDMKGNALQGAEFTLYDREGKEVATKISDKDGIVTFNDVDYGSYTVKETKAPKGYILSEEKLEIKVSSPETQNFIFKNEAEKFIDKISNVLPKTGSLFNYKVIMMIGWGTIIMGLGSFLKKNKVR
ncbi:Ig-like domain-containing protein [Clostridium algidicarnis]|uniref:SpaA isopeptide-forming pilin-related protein n=2 Tax=Clostridium algidicarnis TaxID=37659 RepID=UPI001CF58F93|nr:SpaA isopeptide-forming pilin-related protein [Clostridium algidicarnis]MCB2286462.1 Ig-like domain-containing protein [Clostridium algidicarnis]